MARRSARSLLAQRSLVIVLAVAIILTAVTYGLHRTALFPPFRATLLSQPPLASYSTVGHTPCPSLLPTERQMQRKAFVTLMADVGTAWNTLCLAYFLKFGVMSKYPLLVMVLDDTLGPALLNALGSLNAKVQKIEKFPIEPTNMQVWRAMDPRWRLSLHRLSMFGFSQWDRLAYLDSDMYVRYNADEMLDIGGPITVTYGTGGINAGAMVFEPGAELYRSMVHFARAHAVPSRANERLWRKSDQSFLIGFLKEHFGGSNKQHSHPEDVGVPVAAFIYNHPAIFCDRLTDAQLQLVKIFHFTFTPNHTKPLGLDPDSVTPPCFRGPVKAFHDAKVQLLTWHPDLRTL